MDPNEPNFSPFTPPQRPTGSSQAPIPNKVFEYEPPPAQQPRRSGFGFSNGSIQLFRVFGITVFLHWTWFIAAIYLILRSGEQYSSLAWNVAEYLGLFAIVLMHEFGHALACRSVGGKAEKITLWPLGGVAFVSPPPRPGPVLWSIAAGPLVNVLLVPITLGLWYIDRGSSSDLHHFFTRLAETNGVLLIFNMLPIYPLDGGQILQSLLWFVLGRGRSLMIAAWVGLVGAGALALLALYFRDTWLVFVAVFAGSMAWNGIRNAKALLAQQNAPRHPNYACPSCGKSPLAGAYWTCPCGFSFDTFANGGMCPRCGRNFDMTQCLDCRTSAPLGAWARRYQPQVISGTPYQMPFSQTK